ncbi:MAG TPA: hypothetical protein VNM48_08455 [Chloroflexota bacterium]|nr:hypothetical protein [Chloroflexota bacterium]
MPGEVFTGQARAGLETVYATGVVPTRKLYLGDDSSIDPGGSNVRHALMAGTRSRMRASSRGVQEPGGSYSMPVESAELLEMLRIGVDGAPVITSPNATTAPNTRLHTYLGGVNPLSSATLQFFDGANPWQMVGVYAGEVRFTGAPGPGGENKVAGSLFGSALTQTALTGTVTDRTPIPYAGWEATLAIDSVGGTDNYGTTVIAAAQSVTEWDVLAANNNPARVYTAANTRNAQAAVLGEFDATGSLSFLASGARALTEYNDFAAGVQKRLRITLGNNTILEGAFLAFVTVDVQIIWTAFDLTSASEGVRTYSAEFAYIHDASNGFASRVRCQNSRLTSF